MPCSAVTLSLATITSIIAVALLTIAFATDNWLYIEVKRTNIQTIESFTAKKHFRHRQDIKAFAKTDRGCSGKVAGVQQSNACLMNQLKHPDAQSQALVDSVNSKYYYYTRTKGLFRICYPKERPPTVKTYLSPVETHCNNINYYIPDENNETRDFTDDAWTRLHMGRSMIALFIIAFGSIFASFCTGVTGCWRRSPGNITATAILMLLACLLSAGAMGLWHGVEYFEKEKVVGEEFYQQWSNVLRENSTISYDWSFFLAWLSVLPSLVAAILFFCGSGCLRTEKEREHSNNVQYIMPVYPQKQQYAYAGYPAPPPQAYTGPYYHGSVYGPYNY